MHNDRFGLDGKGERASAPVENNIQKLTRQIRIGIDVSETFHPFLGPLLMLSFAALSNTLFVSLLVAILTGTYTTIASDAVSS